MFLRQLYDEKLAVASYLIGCQRSGEAIVIDPQRDIDRYEKVAAAHGLRIIAAAETHIHADFLSGARAFAERGATVYLSDEGDADWKYQWLGSKTNGGAYAHQLLHDGDVFRIGGIEFTAVHTPGHTPEHLCFVVTDSGGGATKPMGVLTGDFVFVGDLGRPDLLESAAGFAGKARLGAERLYATTKRFFAWSDYMQVWPAHGAGSACGKALGAVPQSTVGYERLFNPALLAATSEQQFVEFILADQPEPPLYFATMKRVNKMGPRVLAGVPKPKQLSVSELREQSEQGERGEQGEQGALIIDTRPWAAFKAGHLPGALYIPLTASFPTDAGSFVRESDEIHLIVEAERLDEAVRDLIRVGLDRISGWCDANTFSASLNEAGALRATPELSVAEARAFIASDAPFVLDVRRAVEFAGGHLPNALNISHTRLLDRLGEHLHEIPRDRVILVNCHSGGRSSRACSLLERHGYDARNLAGGMLAWRQANAPIAIASNAQCAESSCASPSTVGAV